MIRGWGQTRWLHVGMIVVLSGLYAPVLMEMAPLWWHDSYAGHGMFVPLFSAFVAWMERDRLRAAAGSGSATGLILVLVGLGFLALGHGAESLLVQGLSVPVTVAGVVWSMWGRPCLRCAAFPVWFLALMVPPPHAAAAAVTLALQLFAASFAAVTLRALDIQVYQTGVTIELPNMTLQVAEVCNGIRFLMALLVLTAAFAQVTQRTVLRKIILTASAVPAAILSNAARVAAIAVGVYVIGPEAARGTIHDWIGKSVHLLTLIPLVGLGFLLSRMRVSRPPVDGARGDMTVADPTAAP